MEERNIPIENSRKAKFKGLIYPTLLMWFTLYYLETTLIAVALNGMLGTFLSTHWGITFKVFHLLLLIIWGFGLFYWRRKTSYQVYLLTAILFPFGSITAFFKTPLDCLQLIGIGVAALLAGNGLSFLLLRLLSNRSRTGYCVCSRILKCYYKFKVNYPFARIITNEYLILLITGFFLHYFVSSISIQFNSTFYITYIYPPFFLCGILIGLTFYRGSLLPSIIVLCMPCRTAFIASYYVEVSYGLRIGMWFMGPVLFAYALFLGVVLGIKSHERYRKLNNIQEKSNEKTEPTYAEEVLAGNPENKPNTLIKSFGVKAKIMLKKYYLDIEWFPVLLCLAVIDPISNFIIVLTSQVFLMYVISNIACGIILASMVKGNPLREFFIVWLSYILLNFAIKLPNLTDLLFLFISFSFGAAVWLAIILLFKRKLDLISIKLHVANYLRSKEKAVISISKWLCTIPILALVVIVLLSIIFSIDAIPNVIFKIGRILILLLGIGLGIQTRKRHIKYLLISISPFVFLCLFVSLSEKTYPSYCLSYEYIMGWLAGHKVRMYFMQIFKEFPFNYFIYNSNKEI